jgi:acetyltransferase-like isoleucine patch superfamily enzyme
MKTREKIMVFMIFKYSNILINNDKNRAIFLNKIFSNLHIQPDVCIRKNITYYGSGELFIGKNSFINEECFLDISSKLIIKSNVAIGMRTVILTSTHKIEEIRCGKVKRKVTRIEDNVWIGANVTIYPGINIGSGCVISAGEVVDIDVPNNMILKKGKLIPVKKENT